MKKSNIFAYMELKKLVDNLQHPHPSIKETIVTQAAYFHILDPKYFSDELAPEWTGIREKLGYSTTVALKGQQFLKNTMLSHVESITEKECQEIIQGIHKILSRLSHEFE